MNFGKRGNGGHLGVVKEGETGQDLIFERIINIYNSGL